MCYYAKVQLAMFEPKRAKKQGFGNLRDRDEHEKGSVP
jgi:hypothetical protein